VVGKMQDPEMDDKGYHFPAFQIQLTIPGKILGAREKRHSIEK
jgi:hypothetical protein